MSYIFSMWYPQHIISHVNVIYFKCEIAREYELDLSMYNDICVYAYIYKNILILTGEWRLDCASL